MIVVTAPAGSVGSQLVHRLLAADQDVRVIARFPTRLDDEIRDLVDVVEGSHGDATVLAQALDGADTLFWLVPPDPTAASLDEAYTGFSRPALDAMRRGEVRRVVGISALGRGTPQVAIAGNVTATLALDDRIAETGVDYRALVLPSFMDNINRQAQLIRDRGFFTSPIPGDHPMPVCATADIAEVAARVLADPGWSGAGEVPVLGPADLCFDEMAEILTDVLGTPVTFRQVDGAAFVVRMTSLGMSGAMAQGLLDMALAKAAGLDNAVPRTLESTTPTTFREWCETHLGGTAT